MDRTAPTRSHQDLPRRVGKSISTSSIRRWQRAHTLWVCVQYHVPGGVGRQRRSLEDGSKDAYSLEFRGDENSIAETPRLYTLHPTLRLWRHRRSGEEARRFSATLALPLRKG